MSRVPTPTYGLREEKMASVNVAGIRTELYSDPGTKELSVLD